MRPLPDASGSVNLQGARRTAPILSCVVKLDCAPPARRQRRQRFELVDLETKGSSSRKDIRDKLNQLVPNKQSRRDAAVKMLEKGLIPR